MRLTSLSKALLVLAQCSISVPPENVRKTLAFKVDIPITWK